MESQVDFKLKVIEDCCETKVKKSYKEFCHYEY